MITFTVVSVDIGSNYHTGPGCDVVTIQQGV